MNESGISELDPTRKIGVKDFSKGFFESSRLYLENLNKRSSSGAAVITGLISVFPERINFESLNKTKEFHRLCAVTHVAVLINDYIDMGEYLATPEGKELKLEIEERWGKTLDNIGFSKKLPEEDRLIVKSYMAGITLHDDEVRRASDNSSAGIIKAKEMENAISLVHCAAVVLDPEEIDASCFNLHECVHEEYLEKNYSWLINGEPTNEVQRRLCAVFNVIMLAQTIDDRFDYKIDDKLNIRNVYSAILSECHGDRQQTNSQLTELQKRYYANARKFGITNLALVGNEVASGIFKSMQHLFPNMFGGYREKLLK